MSEEVIQPLTDIDLCQFAASHEGIYDSCILGRIVVAADVAVALEKTLDITADIWINMQTQHGLDTANSATHYHKENNR